MRSPEIERASIVMLGSFNPAIFQPRWLGTLKLIRPEEAETAKITTIQAELTDFSTEWFQLQVLQTRLLLTSADPRNYAPLRDLAAGIFVLLPHTPINTIGLSRAFHFAMPSTDEWHRTGHLLAPKEPWNEILKRPGLRSMMMEGYRKEQSGGTTYVKIEPSLLTRPGLFIEINEEFKRPADSDLEGAQWIPPCLAEHWDDIMQFASGAAEHLLGLVKTDV